MRLAKLKVLQMSVNICIDRIAILKPWGFTLDHTLSPSFTLLCTYQPSLLHTRDKYMTELKLESPLYIPLYDTCLYLHFLSVFKCCFRPLEACTVPSCTMNSSPQDSDQELQKGFSYLALGFLLGEHGQHRQEEFI